MATTVTRGQVKIPWSAWYEDREEILHFPEEWEILVAEPAMDLPPLTDDEIRQRLAQPLGTKPIRELARGKKRVAVAIDDLTRPTPTKQLLPLLFEELRLGGVEMDQIAVLVAMGSHRFLTRLDLLMKLGPSVCSAVAVYNHHPYENLSLLGRTTQGTDVYINKQFVESDLRISVGTIMPHSGAGMSGGPKTVGIGLAGIETLLQNHDPEGDVFREPGAVGSVDNPLQLELLEMARMSGLDLIFNVVLNRCRQTTGVFVGDVQEAFSLGAQMARELWMTEAPRFVDVGIFNSYPKDTEATLALTALTPAMVTGDPVVRKGGVMVITTASPEGTGIHQQEGNGMRGHHGYYRLPQPPEHFMDRQLIIYSPNLTKWDLQHIFAPGYLLLNEWEQVIEALLELVPARPRVAVFPVAATQLAN